MKVHSKEEIIKWFKERMSYEDSRIIEHEVNYYKYEKAFKEYKTTNILSEDIVHEFIKFKAYEE